MEEKDEKKDIPIAETKQPKKEEGPNIVNHLEGLRYLVELASNNPKEYTSMYNSLPPATKTFLNFLYEKAQQIHKSSEKPPPGRITTVTNYKTKGAAEQITLIENARGQQPDKRTLCTIFNALEREGFKFVTAGGAIRQNDSELVFVLRHEGKES